MGNLAAGQIISAQEKRYFLENQTVIAAGQIGLGPWGVILLWKNGLSAGLLIFGVN